MYDEIKDNMKTITVQLKLKPHRVEYVKIYGIITKFKHVIIQSSLSHVQTTR